MIRRKNETETEVRKNMRDGDGQVEITKFVSSAELYEKGRLFAKLTLEPGCSIGYHTHEADSEIFYILKGEAVYSDNGKEVTVSAGDVTVTPKGEGHSIANRGTETVEVIAVIVYA